MSKKQEARSKKQAKEPVIPARPGIQPDDTSDVSAEALVEANEQINNLTNDLQRIQAEFINYKNRVENEKATLSQFSKAQTIKELLPVIDDLERALSHLPDELADNKWAQGTQKVHERLLSQLKKMGVQQIEALNQPFDPNLHEAVQVEGEGDQQLVAEVLQSGYQLGDHIIRHSIVKVINS